MAKTMIEELPEVNREIILPKWIDDLIFNELGARYCPSNSDMTVIDWDKSKIENYLGTYFPRSYAEAYCIFTSFFIKNKAKYSTKEELSVFDFGSGTGGEIIGLLTVISEQLPNIKTVNIKALDGNKHELRLYEQILKDFVPKVRFDIDDKVIPFTIDDFYDMSVFVGVIKEQFDIIITFKAICEIVTKQQFDGKNPYEHFANTFLSKLKDDGVMLIEDVTSQNKVSQKWLPSMMDAGLLKTDCVIKHRNNDYSEAFHITHSRKSMDLSKVAWRIITKNL